MHVLIVLAHPEPASLNGELAHLAARTLLKAGHTVELSDLYGSGFDPREAPYHYQTRRLPDYFDVQLEQRHAGEISALPRDVAEELARVERADLILFQFPMWWFSVPAILKGWVDRVLIYGTTYTSQMRYDRGRLRGRRAMVSVTLGGAETTFAHNGRGGDIELLLWPFHMSLHYVGLSVLPPLTAFGVDGSPENRQFWKERLVERLNAIESDSPLPFNGWDDWDEKGQLKPGVRGYSLFMRAER